jgi:hypothetical protein
VIENGGTTSVDATSWRVQIYLDGDTRESVAAGAFDNGYIAKLWMCDQLRLISVYDRRLRAVSGYSYVGVAESARDVWRCRLIDCRTPIVWDAANVGGPT